jgi:hypothetical protein
MDTHLHEPPSTNLSSTPPSSTPVLNKPRASASADAPALGGWVLDVGALLSFADGTALAASVRALAVRSGRTLLVPLPALAVAAVRRAGSVPTSVAHARLADLLAEPFVLAVDGAAAVGPLFDRLLTRAAGDRLAALVVMLGIQRCWPVLTDRGEALRRIRPDLMTIPS